MTLREWYAGQALSGLLADEGPHANRHDIAARAFGYADAMLEQSGRA